MLSTNSRQTIVWFWHDRKWDLLMLVAWTQCGIRRLRRWVGPLFGREQVLAPARPDACVLLERDALIDAWSAYVEREQLLDFNVVEFWFCEDNYDGTTTMFWRENAVGADRRVPSDLIRRTRDYEHAVRAFLRSILDEDASIRMFEPLDGGARIDIRSGRR